jgi:hexosaminidase
VWTEYIANTSKLEYMVFPRMMALSEVLWSPKAKRDWKDFERRLPTIFERLDKDKVNYSKAYYDLKAAVVPTENNEGVYWKLESNYITALENKENALINVFSETSDSISEKQQFPVYNKNGDIVGFKDSVGILSYLSKIYKNPLLVRKSKEIRAQLIQTKMPDDTKPLSTLTQSFYFNKATGKKITLKNQPNKTYPGDGAFTLVNGVQNEKGTARSSEFVGFQGTDLDATIDFGKDVEISTIKLHTLNQNRSWIYLPTEIEVSFMPYIDTTVITKHPPIVSLFHKVNDNNNVQVLKLTEPKTCRYLRVRAKNFGTIQAGQPGEGKQAWLFVDEIEVE